MNQNQAKIISIIGAKGGVGQTTVAINLAYKLAKAYLKNVSLGLIDLNFTQPDCSIMLNLKPKNSLIDLINNVDNLDKDLVNSCASVIAENLKALVPPTDLLVPNKLNSQVLINILNKVQENYPLLIIDLPKHIDESLINVLDMSYLIILVTDSSIESIISSNRWQARFNDLGYNANKIIYIFNKTSKFSETNLKAIDNTNIYKINHCNLNSIATNANLLNGQANRDIALIVKDIAQFLNFPAESTPNSSFKFLPNLFKLLNQF